MGVLALRNINISHFRSHKNAKFEMQSGLVVLYGSNGVGKTNVLEAISLLSPGRGLRSASSNELAKRPDDLGWKIIARLDCVETSLEISTWSNQNQARQVAIDGKKYSQIELGKIVRMLWTTPTMDRLWIDGSMERRRFLDRLVLTLDHEHTENTLRYNKAMAQRNRLIRDQIVDDHWYNVLESQMAKYGYAIDCSRRKVLKKISVAQNAIGNLFPSAELELFGLEFDGEEGYKYALKNGRKQDIVAGRCLIGPHKTDLKARYLATGMEAQKCSTGEQKSLMISIILATAKIQINDFKTPPILLLDEVSAHLDTKRRRLLFDELYKLNAQVFLTGTELDVFKDLGKRAQIIKIENR